MESMENNHAKLLHLQKAKKIFEQWQSSYRAGLTNETFTACIQTISTIPKPVAYLVEKQFKIFSFWKNHVRSNNK